MIARHNCYLKLSPQEFFNLASREVTIYSIYRLTLFALFIVTFIDNDELSSRRIYSPVFGRRHFFLAFSSLFAFIVDWRVILFLGVFIIAKLLCQSDFIYPLAPRCHKKLSVYSAPFQSMFNSLYTNQYVLLVSRERG